MTWPPETAVDLHELLRTDALDETGTVEFKREVGTTPAQRKKVARTLASFATDGGWLIIGVDERKGEQPQFVPLPVPLKDQRERLDDLARTAIHPPLSILVELLDGGDGQGQILVRVPASPHVLHAVDNTYWGRRDSQTAALQDGAVERLMRLRDTASRSINEQVDTQRLLYPELDDQYWSILVRLEPRTPQLRPLRTLIADPNDGLLDMVRSAEQRACQQLPETRSDQLTGLSNHWWQRRLRGAASTSPGLGPTRRLTEPTAGDTVFELLVSEDGSIQIWYGETNLGYQEGTAFVSDREIIGFVAAGTALSREVSRYMRFDGQWTLGIRVDGLFERHALPRTSHFLSSRPPYPDPTPYREATTFETRQTDDGLTRVVRDVCWPLLHALGTEHALPAADDGS